MQVKCVVVDLCDYGAETISEQLATHELADDIQLCDVASAESVFNQDHAVVLIVHAQEWNDNISLLLAAYMRLQGPNARFAAVVCDAPSVMLLSGVFEFGIDRFIARDSWYKQAEGTLRQARRIISERTAELQAIRVNQAIARQSQDVLRGVHNEVKPFMGYDYLAAYAVGRAREALGNFQGAVGAFQLSRAIYPNFRPAVSGLAENLLILGKTNEAWSMLTTLEGWFQYEVGRKVLLVCAALADGDESKAEKYLSDAEAISQTHPRVIEARVQVLLAKKQLQDAFALLDEISDAGALFASRLNEVGIQLSQQRQGKNALALYRKAHRIVRPELKYKISLNAALAAHRTGDFALAMEYVDQTEQEYGGSFDKLEKIRQVVGKRLKGGPSAA